MDEIHSYENYLAQHNPELRRSHGVFYIPQPAVSYIVRAVDDILRRDFKLRDGLADTAKVDIDGKKFHRVQILDPATGVGTFLFEVITQIHMVGGTFYVSGLYGHAVSTYKFDLGGHWKTFRSGYGLQDGHEGSVVFVVCGDGRELFRSERITDKRLRRLEVSVADVKELELIVEDGGDGVSSDWGVGIEPAVER